MKLSPRLELIRKMIVPCECLADIGTDHALIPAVAVREGLCSRSIATDIQAGPLERAKKTINQYQLTARIETCLGAGLQPIRMKNCDAFVIAGMGSMMMIDMLEKDEDVAKRAKYILLQPMHAQEKLRPWLQNHGYEILSEELAEEGKKHYQVIAVRHMEAPKDVGLPKNWLEIPCTELSGLPSDPKHTLYHRVGYGIVNRPDQYADSWIMDWIIRQQTIVEGMKRANKEKNDGFRENEVLENLWNCYKIVHKKMNTH